MDSIDHITYPSESDHLEWLDEKLIDPIPFHEIDRQIGNPFLEEKSLLLKTKQGKWQQEEYIKGRYTYRNNTFSVDDLPRELDHPYPLYYHDNVIDPSPAPPPLKSSLLSTTATSIDHQAQQNVLGNEANDMIERRYQRHDSNGYHPSTSMIPSFGYSPNHVCSSIESEQYPHSAEIDPSISSMRETPTLQNADSLDFNDKRDYGAQSTFVESKSARKFAHPSSYEVQTAQYHQPLYFDHHHTWHYHFQETNYTMTANQQFHPHQYQSYSSLPVESSRHPFPVHHISSDEHEYPSPQVQISTSGNYAQSTQKKRSFEECSGDGEVTDEKNPRRPISAYNFFFMEEKEIVIALLSSKSILLSDDHSNDHDFSVIKEMDADALVKYLDEVSNSIDSDKFKDFQDSIHKKTEEFLLLHYEEDRFKKPHKKRHGLVSFLNLARVIGKRWRAKSPELKKRYHNLATQDKKRFNEMVNNSHL